MEADYLVLGSGLAGLYFALRACPHGRVVIVSKRELTDSNTQYAQGGVAGVLGATITVSLAVHWTGFRLFHVLLPKNRTAC